LRPAACFFTDGAAEMNFTARSETRSQPEPIEYRQQVLSNRSDQTQEGAVNWEQVKGRWNQTKGAVKKQWGKLTDEDLTVIAGQRDQLVGKIQERYGIAKEEADKQVKTWESMKANEPDDVQAEEKRKAS